jgi:ElaB/YqjD/DUF883 family membrane-anchored ribosome-binding protein
MVVAFVGTVVVGNLGAARWGLRGVPWWLRKGTRMASAARKTHPAGSVVHEMRQDAKQIAEEWRESAQAMAEHGARYVQGRVHEGLRHADGLLQECTGRSASHWRSALKAHVRQHPLRSFGIMVGVGFAIGKLLQIGGTPDSLDGRTPPYRRESFDRHVPLPRSSGLH